MGIALGFVRKIFGLSPPACAIEAYVAQLTPRSMSRKIRTASENIKIPLAQSMSVIAFSASFTKGLRHSAINMPGFKKNEWPFPYEKILTEAAAFYYFCMIKDYLPKRDEEGEWDDYDDDSAETDPYLESLRISMRICGNLIHTLSDGRIPELYLSNRALSFWSIKNSPSKDVIDSLHEFIIDAWNPVWNPNRDSTSFLQISAAAIATQISIVSMPIDGVRDACRELYDLKMKHSQAY